jgi:putative ABC transport system substrate-binding protein
MSRNSIYIISAIAILFMTGLYRILVPESNKLPIVAIINYGPHSSLNEIIRGVKDGLYAKGFREGKTIEFMIEDANFDNSAIMRILNKVTSAKPKVIIAISTPIARAAKDNIKNIPIIFAGVTDPVEAGILTQYDKAEKNITGTSDKQDLGLVLKFAKKLSSQIQRVGLLYATGEANDIALVKLMKSAAEGAEMELVALSIETAHDIPDKMRQFNGNVDMIYVGASGPVQPSLPIIVTMAESMQIPVFNMNAEEVKESKVFASYGVSYYKVGIHAGELVSNVLRGAKIKDLDPIYPSIEDHDGFISAIRQNAISFQLPRFLPKSTYIVK